MASLDSKAKHVLLQLFTNNSKDVCFCLCINTHCRLKTDSKRYHLVWLTITARTQWQMAGRTKDGWTDRKTGHKGATSQSRTGWEINFWENPVMLLELRVKFLGQKIASNLTSLSARYPAPSRNGAWWAKAHQDEFWVPVRVSNHDMYSPGNSKRNRKLRFWCFQRETWDRFPHTLQRGLQMVKLGKGKFASNMDLCKGS